MKQEIATSLRLLVLMTVLCGLCYPLGMTAVAQTFFAVPANGSLIEKDGRIVGSQLIGQSFESEGYFWSRPSASSPSPYNASGGVGSNWGPSNPALRARVETSLQTRTCEGLLPIDWVTASGSGLDPHISPASAYCQVQRIAAARGLPENDVRTLIERYIEGRTFGILGEPRVNVLELNLALNAQAHGEQVDR